MNRMDAILSKLEQAIADLESQKQKLFSKMEQFTWKDDRVQERIPEQVIDYTVLLTDLTSVSPEAASLPSDAHRDYQKWFSAVRVIVAKNQPSRLAELDELYEEIKSSLSRKNITKDSFLKLKDNINYQFDLLAAVPNHLRYLGYDTELQLYSILMDDELLAAKHLLSKGFLRSSGALAGVLLERHLKNLLSKHTPPIKVKKNATLSTLNDACKDSIYDLVTWRKIQHLADIRNLCAHDKQPEPKKSEVEDLLSGVSSILKLYN